MLYHFFESDAISSTPFSVGLEKLHAFAHQFNMRTIIWNRRDYPGSTPYTDSELEDLSQGRKIFIDRAGSQLGEFLFQLVDKEQIPRATDGGISGGIAIMGWSVGEKVTTH